MKKYANYLCVLILFSAAVSVVSGQLVGSYSFEESWSAAGDPLVNSVAGESGAWGNGTASSSTFDSTAEGVILTGVSFGGIQSFDTGVSLADGADFTLMGWAKCPVTTSSRGFLFGQYSNVGSTGSNNFYFTAADNRAAYGYKAGVFINGSRLNSSAAYNDNQWHLFAFTYDGATARLYVDGQEVDSMSIASLDLNQNSNLAIGNLSNVTTQCITAQGHYDELKVYDSVLSGTEILAIFESKLEVNVDQTDGGTEVVEGGLTDSYSISIGSEPSDDVVITCMPPASLDLGAGVGNSVVLTFTPANWTSAQTVTVVTVDDSVFIGSRVETITHTIASNDNDYNVISVSNVDVSIIDDDITLSDGLIAYYKFDWPVSSNNIVMNSVYGHTGTWGHAYAGGDIDFTTAGIVYDSATFVELPTNLPVIDPNNNLSATGDFTLTGWAKASTAPANRCMMFGQYSDSEGNTAGNMYLMSCDKLNEYKARWFLGANCPALLSTDSYNDDQWHHYAATREGNIFSLYVDGVLVATETAAGVSLNDGTGLGIGNLTNTYAKRIVASGSLDELKIYTSALSSTQIEAAYNEYAGSTIVITETDGDTKVVEGYSTDSYMLSLAFEPTSDVSVTLSNDILDYRQWCRC